MTYYTYRFTWPANPDTHTVVVTGNFDNWSQSQGALTKDPHTGVFETVLRVRDRHKLVFKFVVNGEWITDDNYKIEHDEHGIPNNYVDAAELTEVLEFEESNEDEKLTNVLTAGSLYAAVSIPASSDFEDVGTSESPESPVVATTTTTEPTESVSEPTNREADGPAVSEPTNREAGGPALSTSRPEDVTPTTSNTGGLSSAPTKAQDAEVTTLGPSSRNSSFTGAHPGREAVDAVKVPGLYPSPVNTPEKPGGRRDGLISRLKGLFRS